MLFKVYARNCTCAKRISEATVDDLKNVIDNVFQQAWENDLIDILSDEDEDEIDIKKEDSAYSKIWAYWEENKEISAGDFAIVEKESFYDVKVPNVYYGDAFSIF